MHLLDDYDLAQASPNSEPGFHLFYSKKHDAWYFHCNDIHGQPILFSQAYQQESSAEKGLASVLKSAPKRTQKEAVAPDHWQFVVKAGNHKEIGRSRLFSSEVDCETGMKYLKQVAKSQDPLAKSPSPQPQQGSVAAEADTELETDSPVPDMRHTFRLYFYEGEQEQLSGRIEVAASREQAHFTGIDLEAIGSFLGQHLPHMAKAAKSQVQVSETTLEGQLQHRTDVQTTTDFRMLDSQEQFQLFLHSPILKENNTLVSLELKAYHTTDNTSQQITVQQIQRQEDTPAIDFVAQTTSLQHKGIYMLTAKALLRTDSSFQTLQGNTLIQLV